MTVQATTDTPAATATADTPTDTPKTGLGDGAQTTDTPAEKDPQGNKQTEEPGKKEGEEKKDEDKGKGKEEKKDDNELFGKPEAYDYKDVKLPEGMALNEDMTKRFNEYADKLNLSQKGANDLMAMAVELTQKTQQQTVEAMGKFQAAKIEGYRQLLNSDKEVGGAHLKESIATANVAYDAFFPDEELRTMLAEGGLNVHPKFIKALKAIGSQMKNDTIHTSGNPTGEKKAREDILYPSMQDNE